MTISPISSILPPIAEPSTSSASSTGAYGTEIAPSATSDSTPGLLHPPQLAAPTAVATYPKSVVPQPLPPAFPEPHLPPADPMAQEDTVTISEAARRAAQASAELLGATGEPSTALA